MTKQNLKYLIFSLLFFNNYSYLFPLGSAGSLASYENRYIVDMPNCGLISDKKIALDILYMKSGSLSLAAEYSFLNTANAGLSYSMNNIIGNGEISSQKYPGISLKVRLIDETYKLPAIALGFSNQSRSVYLSNSNRFQVLSPGLYFALSKSFRWKLGYLASHFGVNYSFDNDAPNRTPNVYFGIEQSINSFSSINLEYNLQLDETKNKLYNSKGLLNVALRAGVISGLTLELQLKDLLNNNKEINSIERQFGIEIFKSISF
ncbi:MAG TPA: hypothetical protein PLE30_04250 [Candidatus Kapabacteria bacterium]|nr:hypothetical protein [Candidatus Kapabacteria bacterium]